MLVQVTPPDLSRLPADQEAESRGHQRADPAGDSNPRRCVNSTSPFWATGVCLLAPPGPMATEQATEERKWCEFAPRGARKCRLAGTKGCEFRTAFINVSASHALSSLAMRALIVVISPDSGGVTSSAMSIAVSEQVRGCRIPGTGRDEVLRRSLGRRMGGHSEMEDLPPVLRQPDPHEEDLASNRGHGKEVNGDKLCQMVLQEGPPCRRGRGAMAQAILLDRGFSHGNAQLPQFAQDARGAAARIRPRDFSDQLTDLLTEGRSTRSRPTEAGPVFTKACALPSDYSRRLHKDHDFPPSRPMPRQPRPENPVARVHLRPPARLLIDRDRTGTRTNSCGIGPFQRRSRHCSGTRPGLRACGSPSCSKPSCSRGASRRAERTWPAASSFTSRHRPACPWTRTQATSGASAPSAATMPRSGRTAASARSAPQMRPHSSLSSVPA